RSARRNRATASPCCPRTRRTPRRRSTRTRRSARRCAHRFPNTGRAERAGCSRSSSWQCISRLERATSRLSGSRKGAPIRRASALALGAGAALLGFLGTGQNSDLLAHLFGFCAGALAALATGRLVQRPPPRSAWQPTLGAATLGAVALAWWFALR